MKKYARPWSLNPRLNPELSKGNARMSILGLPSFETGIQTPVFNGVYPKPSRDDLSNVDEAVVVSSNDHLDSELVKEEPRDIDTEGPVGQPDATINATAPTDAENATSPEVFGNDAQDSKQLDHIVEASDEAEFHQQPVSENAKEIASLGSSEPTPQPGPVPDEPKLSDREPVQEAESPVIKDFAKDGSLGRETAPAIETAEAEQPQIDEAGTNEITEAENEHHTDDSKTPLQPVDAAAIESTQSEIEQADDIPAEPLPSVSDAPMEDKEEDEEQQQPPMMHDSQLSDLGPDDQTESVSGPAGLGPLDVIKEEPPVAEEPATAVHEDKGLENEAVSIGGLEPVDETPEILATGGDRDVVDADDISAQIGVAISADEHQAAGDQDDATPVVEKPEFSSGVSTGGAVQHPPPTFDRKDSMFETPYETPFETPMEKPLNSDNAKEEDQEPTPFETSFETPMERPFWASGGGNATAAPHELEPTEHLNEDEHGEPAEGPLIPRHSPEPELTTTNTTTTATGGASDGDVTQTWRTAHEDATKEYHHGNEEEEAEEEEHHNNSALSAGTGSAAASATDVEPLLSDEMLDVDDEFRPGVKTQSMDYSTHVYGS